MILSTFSRRFAAMLFVAAVATAQQPNHPNASFTVNNVDGPQYPMTASVPVPGTAVYDLAGGAAEPFLVAMSPVQAGALNVGPQGILDLSIPSVEVLLDGFNPVTSLDAFASTQASTGTAMFATAFTTVPQSSAGFGFQAAVGDPSTPLGFRLTAATQLNFQATGSSPSSPVSGFAFGTRGGGLGTLLYEIRAPLDAVSSASVTVLQSVVVDVTATTSVRDASGNNIALSSLASGTFVKVEAFVDAASGALTAHEIRVETPFAGFDVKVDGPVDSASATAVTVLGVPFAIVPGSNVNLSLATLTAGEYVQIKANEVGGSYEIVEIHTTTAPTVGALNNDSFRTRSFVDSASAGSITVLGQPVLIGPGVRLDGLSDPSTLTSADYVEVRANPDSTGVLWAARIKIRSPDSDVRVKGLVSGLASPSFNIEGVTIVTHGGTQWKDGLTGFASLTSGMRAEVKGTWNGSVVTASEVGIDD